MQKGASNEAPFSFSVKQCKLAFGLRNGKWKTGLRRQTVFACSTWERRDHGI